jgi:hypothetical protein
VLPTQTLNQQDFLNLLVTELQNQDPMNPMSDTDFIAQMAQFSTLQQSQQTYQSISEMQATNLIGSTVNVTATDGGSDGHRRGHVRPDEFRLRRKSWSTVQPYTLDEVQTVTFPRHLPHRRRFDNNIFDNHTNVRLTSKKPKQGAQHASSINIRSQWPRRVPARD